MTQAYLSDVVLVHSKVERIRFLQRVSKDDISCSIRENFNHPCNVCDKTIMTKAYLSDHVLVYSKGELIQFLQRVSPKTSCLFNVD